MTKNVNNKWIVVYYIPEIEHTIIVTSSNTTLLWL